MFFRVAILFSVGISRTVPISIADFKEPSATHGSTSHTTSLDFILLQSTFIDMPDRRVSGLASMDRASFCKK
jgi:hypothetical protein